AVVAGQPADRAKHAQMSHQDGDVAVVGAEEKVAGLRAGGVFNQRGDRGVRGEVADVEGERALGLFGGHFLSSGIMARAASSSGARWSTRFRRSRVSVCWTSGGAE